MSAKIANIVITSDLGIKINLKILAEKIPEIKYNPRKFCACILKIKEPVKFTTLIWGSGKIVCLGLKNFKDCESALNAVIARIQDVGFDGKYSGFAVQNIVASFNWGKRINLTKVYGMYPKLSFFEPEIFPGLKFKIHERITVMVFQTGKMMITGAKDMDEIEFIVRKIKRYFVGI